MYEPAGDFDLVTESDSLGRRIETKRIVRPYHFLLD
jgi:hypothetical protein